MLINDILEPHSFLSHAQGRNILDFDYKSVIISYLKLFHLTTSSIEKNINPDYDVESGWKLASV